VAAMDIDLKDLHEEMDDAVSLCLFGDLTIMKRSIAITLGVRPGLKSRVTKSVVPMALISLDDF